MPSLEAAAPDDRPLAVFVAPLLPDRTGNGLAMRAGVWLEALAREHRVVLAVAATAGGVDPGATASWAAGLADRILALRPAEDPRRRLAAILKRPEDRARAHRADPRPFAARFVTAPTVGAIREALRAERPDRLVVLRSYVAPFALPLLESPGGADRRAWLDLDDDEALGHRRLAALHRSLGDPAGAAAAEEEAGRFEAFERGLVRRFGRLATAHEAHAAALRALLAGAEADRVVVVPNAVAIPPHLPPRPPGPELRLLLVGNLGYLPNRDAARRLVAEVAPAVRSAVDRPVLVRIVGSAASPETRGLADPPRVEVVSDAPDLALHYAWADVAIVPLRAGGGTRIKILEAWAHRVPVVATPLAAEGLAAEPGRHLLLGDTTGDLAAACARLAADPALATAVAEAAGELLAARFDRGTLIGRLAGALASPD